MHLGKHDRNIDDKGRLALPAAFRSSFKDTAYVAKAPGDSCITVFLPKDFESALARLETLLREGQASQNEYRQFTASAEEVVFDSQGRIRIPLELRNSTYIEGTVVVAGVGSRIEIWNHQAWQAVESDATSLKGERWL